VQYAKRVVGRRSTAASPPTCRSSQQLRVIPPIFASSILMFPRPWLVVPLDAEGQQRHPGRRLAHNALYVAMIIFFAYFYTAVTSTRWTWPTT
jgi:preprotein translocase subunit SecY